MLFLTLSTLAKIVFVLVVLLTFAPILVWAERRQSSMIQDRVGPVRAGIPMPDYRGLVAAGVLLFLGAYAQHIAVSYFMFDGAGFAWGLVPLVGPIGQAVASESFPVVFAAAPQAATLALAIFGYYSRISCADFLRGPAPLGAQVVAALSGLGGGTFLAVVAYGYARVAMFAENARSVAALQAGEERVAATRELAEKLTSWNGMSAWVTDVLGVPPELGLDLRPALVELERLGASSTALNDAIHAAFSPLLVGATWLGVGLFAIAGLHVVAAYLVKRSVDKRDELTVFGLIHPAVDAVKMIWKEDFTPPGADKVLYMLAPIIATIPAFATFAVIPFGPDVQIGPPDAPFQWLFSVVDGAVSGFTMPLQVANINVGILYIFAIAGTGIVGAAIAGYSSDNKYSLLGGLRAASQMVSYEVTLGLTIVGCFMIYETLLLDEMVAWQAEHGLWGFVVQPLGLILFFFATIAEMKRVPFDAPEGESEIVAGYFLEYSGMKFGLFMTGEFVEHVVSSGIIVTLFFGGYLVPFLEPSGFVFESLGYEIPIWHVGVVLISIVAFLAKMSVCMFLQLQVRWTLPRFRYDQIMQLCWKIILPLSLANILVTGVVILLLEG